MAEPRAGSGRHAPPAGPEAPVLAVSRLHLVATRISAVRLARARAVSPPGTVLVLGWEWFLHLLPHPANFESREPSAAGPSCPFLDSHHSRCPVVPGDWVSPDDSLHRPPPHHFFGAPLELNTHELRFLLLKTVEELLGWRTTGQDDLHDLHWVSASTKGFGLGPEGPRRAVFEVGGLGGPAFLFPKAHVFLKPSGVQARLRMNEFTFLHWSEK